MKDLPARLRALRVVLKSGEYDGADLMRAWCAMAQAAEEIERLELQLTAMSTGSEDERHYAFVRCQGDSVPGQQPCGLVGLSTEEYSRQLRKPDTGWWCPHCGSSAEYDDAASETAQENYSG